MFLVMESDTHLAYYPLTNSDVISVDVLFYPASNRYHSRDVSTSCFLSEYPNGFLFDSAGDNGGRDNSSVIQNLVSDHFLRSRHPVEHVWHRKYRATHRSLAELSVASTGSQTLRVMSILIESGILYMLFFVRTFLRSSRFQLLTKPFHEGGLADNKY